LPDPLGELVGSSLQALFHLLARRNILRDSSYPVQVPFLIQNRELGEEQPPNGAIGAHDACLNDHGLCDIELVEERFEPIAIIWMAGL
jgi:hypothetical protein